MSTPPNIKLKADVGRLIDGEAWKAMEDGRASLEGSLWHLRQGWALEKAEKIIDLVMSDTGSRRTLEHWRQEVGKLHSQIAAKDSELAKLREENERLREVLDELSKEADRAFCRALDQFEKTECLGWEAKARTGQFGKPEFEGHKKANELIGRHNGIAQAVKTVRAALAKEPTP